MASAWFALSRFASALSTCASAEAMLAGEGVVLVVVLLVEPPELVRLELPLLFEPPELPELPPLPDVLDVPEALRFGVVVVAGVVVVPAPPPCFFLDEAGVVVVGGVTMSGFSRAVSETYSVVPLPFPSKLVDVAPEPAVVLVPETEVEPDPDPDDVEVPFSSAVS